VIALRGTSNNKGEKAKIKLVIPNDKIENVRNDFDRKIIDELLRLKNGEIPPNGPYEIELDKFYIQRISENNLDRTQVIESNEHPMFFAFGEGAETHQYQLNVLDGKENMLGENTNDLEYYEKFYDFARPHTILDYEMEMTIIYSNKRIKGIWYNMNYDKNSQNDKVVGVSFKFFVIKKRRRTAVG
jgi:hypothetical protein